MSLTTQLIGSDLIVSIFNKQGHIGAVAVAEFDSKAKRASTSVITRLGHKDDQIAYNAAYRLCRLLRKPVCAIAGIHLDDISKEEIALITRNCDALLSKCIKAIGRY